jgi:hypothetical protein
LKTGTFDTGGTTPGMGVNFDGPDFRAFADGNVSGTFTCPTDQSQSISGTWSASK